MSQTYHFGFQALDMGANSQIPQRVALGASILATAIATTTLLGWIVGVDALKGFGGPITMKANTAVALSACGVSLALLIPRPVRWSWLAFVLATVAGAIGALTLSEHVLGWNLGIDQLLFREAAGAAATASPGRMGPNGAISLVLTSLALLGLRTGTEKSIARAQLLACFTLTLAVIALTGYLYRARELYDIARVTGIALPTPFAFVALALGILMSRTNVAPVAVLMGSRPGSIMARRLLPAALALPVAIGYLRVLGQNAGLYDTGLGTTMFAVALAMTFVVLVWRNARHANALDVERQHAQAEKRASEDRFRRLADLAPVMIVLTDSAKQCIWVNEAWLQFVGRSLEQELGEGWADSLHPDDRARCLETYRRGFDARKPFEMEYRLRGHDGEYRWVFSHGVPSFSDDVFTGYVRSCVDITVRKELEAHQEAAREAAESANRLKDQFLATLSHELRTPLNAILGYARMLRNDVIAPEKRSRAIAIIERNAVAQTQLIEDLLDISRVTSARLRLDVRPISALAPLREALESVRPAAEAKGIVVDSQADASNCMVNGDESRLRQVFWNLVSNAVKFTLPGGRVSVSIEIQDGFVVLTIRDSGIGISPEFLPHVFEPFRQGDERITREQGGLGLGLAICKQLVELHGGMISASSDGAGRGAIFSVRLPVHPTLVDETDLQRVRQRVVPLGDALGSRADHSLNGIDVLVVDDKEDSLDMLRQLLEHAGATVRTAASATDALVQWRAHQPDLVVADIGLPVMDGYQLLRELRAHSGPTGRVVPALAVTAYAMDADRAKAIAAGFQGHVAKPVDPDAFIAAAAAIAHQYT